MRRTRLSLFAALCGIFVSAFASPQKVRAQGEFRDLVKWVPASANALVLVDTAKILSTDVAKRENWKAKIEQAHAAGLTVVPVDATQAVFASQMDLSQMKPHWESVILELDHDPDPAAFAKRTGGKIERIEKNTVVDLPGDAYAVHLGGRAVGAMSPANRQVVGRWLREVKNQKDPSLPSYLMEAYRFANDLGTPIIMALDLDNATTPEEVREMLRSNDKYKSFPTEKLNALSEFLAGIRGVTLGVTFGEKPFGKVKVDFNDKVPFTPAEAKEALLHALAKRGAMLTELNDWTPKVNGNQITLEGDFTSSGMRRLFSLVSPAPTFKQPPSLSQTSTSGSTPSKDEPMTEQSKMRVASKSYFNTVNTYLRDLNYEKGNANSIGSIALWYNSYASKMDRLPTLNVDPELKQFGAYAADSMRAAGSAIQNAGISSATKTAQVAPAYDYYTYTNVYGYVNRNNYWGDGYTGPVGTTNTYAVENRQETERQKRAIRYEERGGAFKFANDTMQEVSSNLAKVRRSMTDKYKDNF